MRALVLGSGSWGTALAAVLARGGREVVLACRRAEVAEAVRRREHPSLPGARLPAGIDTALFGKSIPPVDLVVSTVPTQRLREVMTSLRGTLPLDVPWVTGSKGLEIGTQRLPSRILQECGVTVTPAVLSGPSHAEEVVREVPTAVSLGDADPARAAWLQNSISETTFRVYTNSDPIGVEWGGALKNVVAIASGIAIGQGFGDNTLAALVSRGAVEIARLGVALGGRRETFSGLSGIGDLIVTCFSEHSRNRAFGIRVGRGEDPRAILAASRMAVEGVHTSLAVHELRMSHSTVPRSAPPRSEGPRSEGPRSSGTPPIEMPIAECVHRIVHEGGDVAAGVRSLLARSLKEE